MIVVGSDICALIIGYLLCKPVYLVNYIQCKPNEYLNFEFKISDLEFKFHKKNKSILKQDVETQLLHHLSFCGLLNSRFNSIKITENKIFLFGEVNEILNFDKCIIVNHAFDLPFFDYKSINETNTTITDIFISRQKMKIPSIKTCGLNILFKKMNSMYGMYTISKQLKDSEIDEYSYLNLSFSLLKNKKIHKILFSKFTNHERIIEKYSKYIYKNQDNCYFIYTQMENLIKNDKI